MKFKLPPKVLYIIDSLESRGFEAYAVGGCVRDMVLGVVPKDYDITTNALPEQVKEVFRHTVDTGIQHGTVTVIVSGEGFEITTYRIDGPYTDARHPSSVTFSRSLREDLLRRDFTINAMAYNDRTGLVDIFGGIDDLQRKMIRCVGVPDERFDEDALRVMRAVRFAARFGFKIENETRDAIKRHAPALSKISAERIREELMGLLVSNNPGMIREMYELGITSVILPEFDKCMETPQHTRFHCYNVGDHIIKSVESIENDPVLRITMLLHDISKPEAMTTDTDGTNHFKGHARLSSDRANMIMRRLKFDNAARIKAVKLIYYHDYRPKTEEKYVRRAVSKIGTDLFEDFIKVQRADLAAKNPEQYEEGAKRIDDTLALFRGIIEKKQAVSIKDLSVNGNDLICAGVPKGKCIGIVLDALLDEVLEDPSRNEPGILLKKALEITAKMFENADIS